MKTNNHNKRKNKTTFDIIIEKKIKPFVKAEKTYWELRLNAEKSLDGVRHLLENDYPLPDSKELCSIIWGLKDGVVFSRQDKKNGMHKITIQILPMTLEEWAKEGIWYYTSNETLCVSKIAVGVGSKIVNCIFNDLPIKYLETGYTKYDDSKKSFSLESALLDLQLTFQGLQSINGNSGAIQKNTTSILSEYRKISDEFRIMLGTSHSEEDLQKFLHTNHILLSPTAHVIPKHKLGDDFVTDFILIDPFSAGAKYTLVEIEKACHKVLNQDFSLTSLVSHAINQTVEWDCWLEKNKDYLQRKLPNFESPQYIIVIGRSSDFTEIQKERFRGHQRRLKDIKLLTYDDLLVQFETMLDKLEKYHGTELGCNRNV